MKCNIAFHDFPLGNILGDTLIGAKDTVADQEYMFAR